MRTFLGIDGGGTKTSAAIVDDSFNVLGRGEAGGSNYHSVGIDAAIENIRSAAQSASEAARSKSPSEVQFPLAAAAFCLAGVRRPPDFERLQPRLSALGLAGRIVLDHDAAGAHYGAFAGGPGILVIAGTGSFAFGLDENKKRYTAGGWGYLFGDEGSAYWIVLEAIRHALALHDAGAETSPLTQTIVGEMGASEPSELIDRVYQTLNREQIASVAPVIVNLAQRGNDTARRILEEAAEQLARLAGIIANRMPSNGSPQVCCVGSVFTTKLMRSMFESELKSKVPGAAVVQPKHDAAIGAARIALEAAE